LSLAVRKRNSSYIPRVDRNGRSWTQRRLVFIFLRTCLTVLLASCAGCAFFYRQPALPKHAAIEANPTPQTDEKFAALVQNADIIYIPTELLGPASRTAPATKLVDALQRGGDSFGIGLDLVGGEEQPLFDQWAKRELSTENLISHLHLWGTERERENCRAFLRETEEWGVRFLALRCPADLLAAARSEPALLAEEFAAERIIRHFREHRDRKLLIFLHRRHLQSTRGVPHLVAQKIRARQLLLDSRPDRSFRSELLALRGRYDAWGRCDAWGGYEGRGSGGGLEIIDGSPRAARDQL
jgi:hypothetical protein